MRGFTHESTHNESKSWYTPREVFTALNVRFDLDPCSPGADVAPWLPVDNHYTIDDDGLSLVWVGNVWLNPPYGTDTPKWLCKLSAHGLGIALVFARTDTAWFHRYAPTCSAICFVAGRIGFVPADKAADYANGLVRIRGGCGAASMLMAWGESNALALKNSGLGITLNIGVTLP